MEMEKQVTSRKVSQKLEKLGVKQDSFWYWGFNPEDESWNLWVSPYMESPVSALTVAELGEILPHKIEMTVITGSRQRHYLYTIKYATDEWGCFYAMNNRLDHHHTESAETLADAMGKMLIYLIENKLVEV